MRVVAIHGTERKESTYHIARQFIEGLEVSEDKVQEFFLPKDAPNFCRGCFQCFTDFKKCPDYRYIHPIVQAMEEADLLILTSPVYVYHVTGQMKAFLDHLGYQWMPHQPNQTMFSKQALIISTAAGGGTKSTIKDLTDNMWYWGVAKVYTYGVNVAAANWKGVSGKKKAHIQKQVNRLAMKIKSERNRIKPSLKVKGLYYIMRSMQKKFGFSEADVEYWKKQGWLDKKKPW